MSGIVWEDPPPRRRVHGQWHRLLSQLVDHPDRWARVSEHHNPRSLVERLRRGAEGMRDGIRVPPGRWEFDFSFPENGTPGYVYARYLGPPLDDIGAAR